MNDLSDVLERLTSRLETLERRVEALEHPSEAASAPVAALPSAPLAAAAGEGLSFVHVGGAFSVLGKAMLGIAGAYLLRAVAETSLLPQPAMAAMAILYALLWLAAATRVAAGAWFASTTYACTSALILAPMLWELTLSFKVLPAAVTAGVLGGFVCAATGLAWKRNLASILWVTYGAAAAVAVVLSIATHELEPFIAVLLLMVLLCEHAAARDREMGVRSVAAAAADVAIWGLIFIYFSPQSARGNYPVLGTAALLAPGFSLFLIDGVSVALRTMLLKRKITAFETVQTTIALMLAAASLLYFEPSGATILGILLIVLSGASYAAVFTFFDRAPEQRNYRVFSTWSAALLLTGCLLCLSPWWAAACLGAAAVAATALGARLSRVALELHGVAYLAAAATASGLLGYAFRALAGTLPGPPAWSVWVASACAVLCYAARKPGREEAWQQQILHLVVAILAAGALAALLVEGLAGLAALVVHPGVHHLAFIRTLTLCAAALGLAFSGSHWGRKELTRMSYAALVLVAAKLVFEDLRQGHMEFIAASIFLFAVTLLAVPRIARMGQRA